MIVLVANGSHTPTKSYGSYLILSGSLSGQHRAFDLPEAKTNNEAEYHSLLKGLKTALTLEPRVKKIRIVMDSKLILNQVMAEWECRAENLKPLCEEAMNLLGEFDEIVLEHVGRETIVSFLGH